MIKTHNSFGTRITKNKGWNVGDVVNVGFLKGLEVVKIEAIKDGLPDVYTLKRGNAVYEFIPHNGLTRID